MSAAPSLTEILDREWSLLIGGRPAPPPGGRYYDDESPVTEEIIAAVPERHATELALLDAIDGGHPVTAMHAGVAVAADTLRLFAGLAIELEGATVPASAEHLHLTVREPYGVVGRIIPFNHPIMFAAAKVAAPLVAGNTVILKPPDSARHFTGVPFGGFKRSGTGREESLDELLSYTQLKTVNIMLA